jgi:hypothetical protein
MSKFIAIIVTATLFALVPAVRAQLVIIPQTTVMYSGNEFPSDQLSITYEVTETGDLYTYSYDLSTSPAVDIQSFIIGGPSDPVNTQGVVISSYGGAFNAGATGNLIGYTWAVSSLPTSADVSYTSPNAPTYAIFSMNGGDTWNSPDNIPAPAVIPEASTLLAGAMMILPLGVGTFRSLRKERSI